MMDLRIATLPFIAPFRARVMTSMTKVLLKPKRIPEKAEPRLP